MQENSLETIMKQATVGTKTRDVEKIMYYPNLIKWEDNRNISKIFILVVYKISS